MDAASDSTPSPSSARFRAFVERVDVWLAGRRVGVAAVAFAALFVLFARGGSNQIGGDQRALADLGWWIAQTGETSLENHPFYRDKATKEFGYWAVRLDDGRVASVYPPGVLLYTVTGHWLLERAGLPSALDRSRETMRVALAIWMALALLGVWRAMAERWGDVAALAAVGLLGAGSAILGTLVQAPWSMTGSTISQGFSIYFAMEALREPAERRETRWSSLGLVASGFFAGWAPVCRPTLALWTLFFGAWLAWRLRGRALWALGGAIAAGAAGAALNLATSGSVAGLYFAKGTGVGFGGNAASIARGFAGILVSPGRGLLVFSPWIVLALAGFASVATRRGRGDSFLVLNAVYVAAMFVVLGTFRMWHGGFSAGPRLQCDMILGAAILAAPALRWLARRWWGWAAVAALAWPAVVVQHRIDRMPDSMAENHRPMAEFEANLWSWRRGAFAWYWTEGGTMRELLGIVEEPALRDGQMDPAAGGARHVLGGVRAFDGTEEGGPRFVACSRRARWVFVPPETYAGKTVWIVIEHVPAAPNYRHEFAVSLNGRRAKTFGWIEGHDPAVAAFRLEEAFVVPGAENVLEIEERSPPKGLFGTAWTAWRRIAIVPEERVRTEGFPAGAVRE